MKWENRLEAYAYVVLYSHETETDAAKYKKFIEDSTTLGRRALERKYKTDNEYTMYTK